MKKNTQALLLAIAAVLSRSTVATAFKVALTYLTHFEMLLIASIPVFGISIPNLNGLLAGMYVGGFEMAIPFICFGIAMRITSNPALINQLCYLSPFLSLFFIAMVLQEPIVITTYIGLVLIVAGIVFNEYFVKKKD